MNKSHGGNCDFENVLIDLNSDINEYHKMRGHDGVLLNELLKKISGKLYYLETVRSYFHNEFQNEINALVEGGKSVSRAENNAHVKYPEMYRLRRIMDGAYNVTHAITMNISYLKKEMNSVNVS
jgi:hypothetical protein|tara:strand:- start:1342 stop:1713 length:372 start_codon:yes stop_codon:yes gene_type:complete